jgi:hypothetical protein
MELILAGTAIFTILQPFINAWINKVNWTPKQKSYVAWAVAILIGAGYVFFTGGITSWYQLFLAAPVIYGYGQAVYQFIVKNLATKFEALTTKGSVVVAPSDTASTTGELVSDATIDLQGGSVTVETPIPVKAVEPAAEEIIRDENVKG